MSNISNRHNVVPFVSGESKAFSGQRLAKVGYKTSKINPAKYPSVCASVPVLSAPSETQLARLMPSIVAMMEDTQDKIFKSLYESADGALSSLGDDDISVDQIISYLESERAGDRLTKERITEWFKSVLEDNLTVLICEKLKIDDPTDARVFAHLNGYRGLFASMSKDSGALQEKQIIGMRKALEVSSVDDEISRRLDQKLESMLNRPKMEELLDLS